MRGIDFVTKQCGNKNIKMSSFNSSRNIQKKESGPDRSVKNNRFFSVTMNELAMEANKSIFFKFKEVRCQ